MSQIHLHGEVRSRRSRSRTRSPLHRAVARRPLRCDRLGPTPPVKTLEDRLAAVHARDWSQRLKLQTQKFVLSASASRCVYCGAPVAKGSVTIDHVHPLAKGGTSAQNNLVAACRGCNEFKDDQDARGWFEDNHWAARNFVQIATHTAVHLMDEARAALRSPYLDEPDDV